MQTKNTTVVAVLIIAVAAAMIGSVMFGARSIGWSDALGTLHGLSTTPEQAVAYTRLLCTVMALAVGAALAVSGTTWQAITRNPMADPAVLPRKYN